MDRWLVAVRIYKTRADAAAACGGGKVRVGGRAVKAAYALRVGDLVAARVASGRVRELEVVRLIDKRVGAAVAAECYVDHSPPVERLADRGDRSVAPAFEREAGAGRPTKRERRKMDRFRGR